MPLWRHDFTLRPEDRNKLQRCLFSDGGLSSNFPIHFFDHLLPNHPTFAITLDEWDERRNRDAVWLPPTKVAGSGSSIPILPFSGLPDFLYRLVNSAKDWQDSLQSVLPGYRERIVHVVLKPDEGGINLNMDAATVTKLADYGEQAGDILCTKFDLDAHRWRRFLVAMARMEETLDEVATSYYSVTGGTEDFEDFLKRYPQVADHYKQEPGCAGGDARARQRTGGRGEGVADAAVHPRRLHPAAADEPSHQPEAVAMVSLPEDGEGKKGRPHASAHARIYPPLRVCRKPAWQPQGRRTGAREAGTSVDAARMWAAR